MLHESSWKRGRVAGAALLVFGISNAAAYPSWIVTEHSVTPGYAAYDRGDCVKFFGQGGASASIDASPALLGGNAFSYAFLNCSASASIANQAQECWTYVVDPNAGQVKGEVELDVRVQASAGALVDDPPGSSSAHSIARLESSLFDLGWDFNVSRDSAGTDVAVGVSSRGLTATASGDGGGPGGHKKGDVQQSGVGCPLDVFMLHTSVFGCLAVESHTTLFNPYSEARSVVTGKVEFSLRLLCHTECP